jgi:hypothetical protein
MSKGRKPTAQESQKALETYYAEEFLKQVGWTHRLEPREAPDFFLFTPDGKVGLEVTQLFKDEGPEGSVYKVREQRKSRYLDKIAAAYYEMGGKSLYVQANLSSWKLDEALIPHIARRLIRNRPESIPGRADFEACTGHYRSIVKFYLTALKAEAGQFSRWTCVENSVGTVRPIQDGVLCGKIEEKATKLPEYRRAAEKTILLIVAEGTRDSGMFYFRGETPRLPSLGFWEVYLLLHPHEARRIA